MIQTQEKVVYQNIPTDLLLPGQNQPRKHFDEETLSKLADSIKKDGIVQPLVIRPLTMNSKSIHLKRYEIIAGERRWRAAQIANIETVPCLIKYYTDEQAARIALIENMHRDALNPIEEARAISNIINETLCTHEEAAISLGISREQVTNLLRFLKLDEPVQQMLIKRELSPSQGKILAGIPKNLQCSFAIKCVKNQWSKRALENAIRDNGKIKVPPKRDIDIENLERNLSDHLGTPVILSEKGCIKIKYANYDIMEGIMEKMGYKEII